MYSDVNRPECNTFVDTLFPHGLIATTLAPTLHARGISQNGAYVWIDAATCEGCDKEMHGSDVIRGKCKMPQQRAQSRVSGGLSEFEFIAVIFLGFNFCWICDPFVAQERRHLAIDLQPHWFHQTQKRPLAEPDTLAARTICAGP